LSKHIGQHEATLSGLAIKRQELEEKLQQHRVDVEVHEKKGQEDVTRYSQIQQQLHSLQQQKNNLLENVSLVRGKMESHKTAGSSDPKTLQANAHTLEGKIAELKKQLDKNLSDNATNQTDLSKQQQTISVITSQLDSLYGQLANPTVVDWQVFDVELLKFEKSFSLFLETLSTASDLEVIRQSQQAISQTFQEFKSNTTTLIKTPQLQNSLHEQLQTLSKQKEALQVQLQSLQLTASKMTLEQEFLQQQIKDLEQQKLGTDLELQKATAVDADSYWQNLVLEESKLQTALDLLGLQIVEIEQSLKDYYQSETQFKNKISEKEKEYRDINDAFNVIKDQQSAQQIEKAKQEAYMESLTAEITGALGLDALANISEHHIHTLDSDVEDRISKLKHQLELTGGVDELTIAEYHETEGRFGNLQAQIEDLRKSMGDLREIMDELDGHIKSKFNEAFHNVNAKFEHYFRLLFNGGRAFLSVVKEQEKEELASPESDDETAGQGETLRPEEKMVQKYEQGSMSISGVDIKATPPGKKLSNIQALSGGERALTSIALLCSLLACFPSPFVVLDEVDAALDESNTIRFGQILASLAHQTQFITITHNRETMANSNILYGVTMGDDGISKLLSIKLEAAKAFAK
jgi:chromosome segregation protein